MTPNQQAFLDMIATSELGTQLLAGSDDGYNVIVGSTSSHPDLFHDYADHPRKLVNLGHGLESSAAGRYQILAHIFDYYKKTLNLSDFSPSSQDVIALQLIRERHALDDVEAGNFANAVAKCSSAWASLPGANYGQHENRLSYLTGVYQKAGGNVAA